MRSGLPPMMRMPKKAAAAAVEKKKIVQEFVPETSKPGDVIPGLNYMKDGKDPVIMEDDKYPEWLFELLKPRRTMQDLEKDADKDVHSLTYQEQRRLMKLINRQRIKTENERKSKA